YLTFIYPNHECNHLDEKKSIVISSNTNVNAALHLGLISGVLRCLYTCFRSLDNKKCDFSIDINQNE
ncbi:MAG: hypothetical protein K2K93_04110, partial [Muribaculaceae bacterium]|nr:hypothetical protein [Muribaculaceae bacterium]